MLPFMWAAEDKNACSVAGELVDGTSVFTISGGPILVKTMVSVCITANGATATTLQWKLYPTVGTATTFSGATATLASATAGTTIRLNNLSLAAAPSIVAASSGGIQIGQSVPNEIILPAGEIRMVVGVGSSTGTWKHYIRYSPMGPACIISNGA